MKWNKRTEPHTIHYYTTLLLNWVEGGDYVTDNLCPVTSKLKGFHSLLSLCVNLCLLSVFLYHHTIGPFISLSLPSAQFQRVYCMCVCVLVCSFCDVCVVLFVTVCFSSSPSFGGIWLRRALVIVSDRGCCWGRGAGIWHILGSVPMRAAWSSKQLCVEPFSLSLSARQPPQTIPWRHLWFPSVSWEKTIIVI